MPRPERDDTSEPDTTLARGKSPATPFLMLGSVALVVFSAVALVTLAALLIWWLSRAETEAMEAAAAQYGRFLNAPVRLTLSNRT